jgi:hypothetical protein
VAEREDIRHVTQPGCGGWDAALSRLRCHSPRGNRVPSSNALAHPPSCNQQ